MFRDDFLEAMSRAANSVSVVTTDGPAGRAGVTVSAMCSVSADRPSLLVCVHHLSPVCEAIRANGTFCVNLLREDQAAISDTFAGRAEAPGGDKFACAEWQKLANGSPALDDGLAAFDCTVMQETRWGSHYIFIGDVVDIVLDEGAPLVHACRDYARARPSLVRREVGRQKGLPRSAAQASARGHRW